MKAQYNPYAYKVHLPLFFQFESPFSFLPIHSLLIPVLSIFFNVKELFCQCDDPTLSHNVHPNPPNLNPRLPVTLSYFHFILCDVLFIFLFLSTVSIFDYCRVHMYVVFIISKFTAVVFGFPLPRVLEPGAFVTTLFVSS